MVIFGVRIVKPFVKRYLRGQFQPGPRLEGCRHERPQVKPLAIQPLVTLESRSITLQAKIQRSTTHSVAAQAKTQFRKTLQRLVVVAFEVLDIAAITNQVKLLPVALENHA